MSNHFNDNRGRPYPTRGEWRDNDRVTTADLSGKVSSFEADGFIIMQ